MLQPTDKGNESRVNSHHEQTADTATAAPTAAYTNAKPYANFVNASETATPVAFTYAGGANVSVVASLKCKPNTTGGTVMALTNSWYLEAGECNGDTTSSNPTGATGTHFYDQGGNEQALPTTPLTAGVPYLLVGTQSGTTLTYYACAPTCAAIATADPHSLATASAGFIGEASSATRIELGDIWNVQLYNYALSAAQVQTLANTAPVDPFPTPTPNANGSYTNASPVPEGGGLGGTTVGPTDAPDAFHIDWDAFCVAQPSHCTSGNPNYISGDQSMVADTLPNSKYGSGVASVCNGAQSTISGETNGQANNNCPTAVGVYYAKTTDPLVTINCNIYTCGDGPNGTSGTLNGAQIYIPKNALPQQNGDGHLSVKQPSGVICQVWLGSTANQTFVPITTASINVGSGACGPSSESTEGSTLMVAGGYASDDEMTRAFIRPEDIVGSNGDGTDIGDPYAFYHGLYGSFANNETGYVYPGIGSDGQCTSSTTVNGVMPMEGMVLYMDTAGFNIVEKWNPPVYLRWLKRALGTIHRHGMFDMDSSGCTTQASSIYVNTLTWGSQAYVLGGGTSPLDAYLTTYIHPYESSYFSSGGSENAIYTSVSGAAYTFNALWYEDVPGLAASNFHWLNSGCSQIAVKGSSSNPC